MLITTDVPVTVFILLTLYLFWRQRENPRWPNSIATGLALGAGMTSKYSGGTLPLLVTALALLRVFRHSDRKQALRGEIRNLAIMAATSC
jgi:4-amino-4-deoxy-L-arabinose transferase-like glycosyltransferase